MQNEYGIRPSMLPMFYQCGSFQKWEGQQDQLDSGREAHAKLAALCKGTISPNDCDDEDVLWAYFEIQKTVGDPREGDSEVKVHYGQEGDADGHEGTADFIMGAHVFDYKRGKQVQNHDYMPQLMDYALCRYNYTPGGIVHLHILFGAGREHVTETTTLESCKRVVSEAISRRMTSSERVYGGFCDWCANNATCEAVQSRVGAVGKELTKAAATKNALAELPNETLGLYAKNWKEIKKLGDIIEKELEARLLSGQTVPGWHVGQTKGRRTIADLARAKELLGLPEEQFLDALSASWEKLYAAYHDGKAVNKAEAKRMVDALLKPVTVAGEDSFCAEMDK